MKKHFLKLGSMLLTVVMLASVGCSDLKNDIQDVNSSVENVKGEVTDLKAALSALQAQLNADFATKNELSALQSTLEGKIGTEVNTLKAQIEALNAAVAGKVGQDDFDAVAGDVEVLKEGYAQTVEALTNLQNAIESAKAELEGAVDVNAGAIEDLTARLTAAEAAAKTMASDIESLKQASMLNVEAIQNLSMTCATLEANIEAAKAYTDKMAEEIYAKIGVVEQALTSVNNLLADETAARIEADEEIYAKIGVVEQALTAVNNLLADEAEKREAEDEEIYKQLNTAVEAISSVNALLEDLAAEDDAIYYEIETLRATVSSVITLHTDLAAEVADVEARLAAQEEAFAAHKEVIDAQVLELKNQLTSLEPVIENLTARTVELKNTIESLGAQVTEDITTLYAQTLELKNTLESLADQYNEDIDTLKAQSLELKNQLESLAPVIKTLQDQSLELKNQLVSLEDVIASLQNEDVEIYKTLEAVTAMISGNYTLIQDLQNEDAEIYKQLQTLTDAISAVNTLTTEAQTKIDAMNEEILASIEDITVGLANQIQSIVVVPGQSLKVYEYTSGDKKSPKMFTAKYEVTPIAAAADLKNANVSFSTVVVKGGEEVTFDAEVIAVDEARGQVTVRGYITEDSEIYATDPANPTTPYVALNVETQGTVTTSVRSSYLPVDVNATTATIESAFVLYDTKTKKVATAPTVEAAYNDKSVHALFENIVPAFETKDGFVTLAEAEDYFGFEVEVEYTLSVDKKYVENENEEPILVVGEDLSATAQIIDVIEDDEVVPAETFVGSYANIATVKKFKVNGKAASVTLASTFEITNVKAEAAIQFETIEHDWTYDQGANASFDARGYEVESATTLKGLELVNNGKFVAKYTVLDANGEEVEVQATATVEKKANKAVTVKLPALPFTKGAETTYTFEGEYTDPVTNIDYSASFDVVLAAMPEDKVIDLGSYTIPGSKKKEMVISAAELNVLPFDAILANINTCDEDAELAAIATELKYVGNSRNVLVNGEEVTSDSQYAEITLATDVKNKVTVDASEITIKYAKVASYSDVYEIVKKYTACGNTYTVKAKVTLEEPVLTFRANPTFVKDGKVALKGMRTAVTTGVTTTAGSFELDVINLRDYVTVIVPDTMDPSEFNLRFTQTLLEKPEGAVAGWSNVAGFAGKAFTNDIEGTRVTYRTLASDATVIDWNSHLTSVVYEIALVGATTEYTTPEEDVVYGSVTVELVVNPGITASLSKVTATYVADANTYAYIAEGLKLKDNAGDIYNANYKKTVSNYAGLTLNANGGKGLFDFYSTTATKCKENAYYAMYEQAFVLPTTANGEFDKSKVTVKMGNEDITVDIANYYDVDPQTGKLTLNPNAGLITGNITFEIPVSLTHKFDNYVEVPVGNVTVEIIK